MDYKNLLLTKAWKIKRQEIIKRDKGMCVNCKSKRILNVHHKQYHYIMKTGNKINPWSYLPQYLVTLCESCHKDGHLQYKIQSFGI